MQSAPRELAVVQRRRRLRLVPAAVTATAGVVGLARGVLPGGPGDLLHLDASDLGDATLAGRVLAAQVGVSLLLSARWLLRGSRDAWVVAVTASAVGAALGVLEARFVVLSAACVLALALLVSTRASHRLVERPDAWREWVWPVALLLGLCAYAASAYAEIALHHPGPSWTPGAVARALLPGAEAPTAALSAFALSVQAGVCAVVLAALAAWWLPGHVVHRMPRADVIDFARRHGTASSAPLLGLPDNTVLELCGGEALAAVAVRNGIAVSLGTPVAPGDLETAALGELTSTCERAGWVPALLALDERQRGLAESAGYSVLQIGVEARLDVAAFSTAGKRRANVRHSVTRARKDGVQVLRYSDATRTPQRDGQLTAISERWLADKGGPELGFTLGRFDLARLEDQEVYVAVVAAGEPGEQVVGFVTWLPYRGGAEAVLDLMRRVDDAPPGTMETLIVDSIADFAQRGRQGASLGGVPLATVGQREGRIQELLGWLYENGGKVYQARGLFRFKDKFDPQWAPMYLAHAGNADLPRVALAALRAYLPPGSVRQVLPTLASARAAWARLVGRARDEASAVRARHRELRSPVARPTAAAWGVPAALAVAAGAAGSFPGPLGLEVASRWGWSVDRTLAGEPWRALTAMLLTRDAFMLLSLAALTGPLLWALARVVGSPRAVLVFAGGAVWGYVGTTLLVAALAAGGWDVAERARATLDYGPSGGTAAVAAVLVALLRRRLLTRAAVGALVVGSALHHQIADVEHLVSFGTVLLIAAVVGRRGAVAAGPDGAEPGSPATAAEPGAPAAAGRELAAR
ncbi:bifunctional lysylphosphatidylglycerol flippase/synthetase MprF [Motilibacter aurantiacus]|uniref:bifunctional lysylphosphatidylglycerol flippase/synthetase MprF n=1 Tax=Motilibacter aurantiacus TaxID=2714955 RepID=UPI00140B52E8|nr:DUF2156 domain-containing protein [Motilibacter aurantiacus]NHC44428.1 DUF2156 domain-containing protein [Motilibacter aurantiacus]